MNPVGFKTVSSYYNNSIYLLFCGINNRQTSPRFRSKQTRQASPSRHGSRQGKEIGGGAATADLPLEANQYRGKAVGFGDISVTLTVDDGQMTAVSVSTLNETPGYARHLGDQFAQQIMASGSIDTVSGATVTCSAVREALAQAMQSAKL
jgi:uncharacterized protein with FMN-binding domain